MNSICPMNFFRTTDTTDTTIWKPGFRELKHTTIFGHVRKAEDNYFSLSCLLTTTFIFLGIFSLVETISLKIWEGPLSQRAKRPLPVCVRGLQDVENHCVHLRDIELKTGRKFVYLRFPHVLFSIKLDWRTWNCKTEKEIFASNPEKGHKNNYKKTWMKWNDTKWTIWYFQQCACVNVILHQ